MGLVKLWFILKVI